MEREGDVPGLFVWEDHEARVNVAVLTNRSGFGDLSLNVTSSFSSFTGSNASDCLNFPPAQRSSFPHILGVELVWSSKEQHFQALDEEHVYQLRTRRAAKLFQGCLPASEVWTSCSALRGYLRTLWYLPWYEGNVNILMCMCVDGIEVHKSMSSWLHFSLSSHPCL